MTRPHRELKFHDSIIPHAKQRRKSASPRRRRRKRKHKSSASDSDLSWMKTNLQEAEVAGTYNVTFEGKSTIPVINADPSPLPPLAYNTYLRMPCQLDPALETELECCGDTGATKTLVDKNWLCKNSQEVEFKPIKPQRFTSVKGRFMVTEKATFPIILPGIREGRRVRMRLMVAAFVMEELGPRLLLGMDWLAANGALIDLTQGQICFHTCPDVVFQPRITMKDNTPTLSRQVIATTTTIIPPKSAKTIPVRYGRLPKVDKYGSRREFAFTSEIDGVLDALITSDGPEMVYAYNDSNIAKSVRRNTRLGSLTDALDATDAFCSNIDDHQEVIQSIIEASQTLESETPKLSMRHPDHLPTKTTSAGVKICSTDPGLADKFMDILDKHDVWTDHGRMVPIPDEDRMRIDLVDGWQNVKTPIRPYPMGVEDREVADKTLDPMHKVKKLEWMKKPTPIACPLFVVWKTVKGIRKSRVVVDLRPLNKLTIPDIYPIPSQEEIISGLQGKKILSVFDLKGFFHQLPVHSVHTDRAGLISPRGLEKSNVVLMGFRNSPPFAQRFMDQLLLPFKHFVRAYIDDVIVFSDNEEDHIDHVNEILALFAKMNLVIAPHKSFVAYPTVNLLGFDVDAFGVAIAKDKVKALRDVIFPVTLADLERWIGAVTFLRKFVPWFQQKMEPLESRKQRLLKQAYESNLLRTGMTKTARHDKKTQIAISDITKAERESFEIVKAHVTDERTLSHHIPHRTLYVWIDASKSRGFGAMLFPLDAPWLDGQPIPIHAIAPVLYLSRLLSKAEKKYQSTEAELACLVWICRTEQRLLQSCRNPFVIITDHSTIRQLCDKTSFRTKDLVRSNKRIMNASIYLSQFNLEVRWIPGITNVIPHALSRLPTTPQNEKRDDDKSEIDDVPTSFFVTIDEAFKIRLIRGYQTDPKFLRILDLLSKAELHDRPNTLPFDVEDGLLYQLSPQGRQLCIPTSCVRETLEIVHDKNFHVGPRKMLAALNGLAIRSVTRQVVRYVQRCQKCGINRNSNSKPLGELQPMSPEPYPAHTLTIDFIVGLPKFDVSTTAFWRLSQPSHPSVRIDFLDSVMTVTDKFTKRVILIPGNSTYRALDWAILLIRTLEITNWGLPRRILSDRDPKFISTIWQSVWSQQGVKLV